MDQIATASMKPDIEKARLAPTWVPAPHQKKRKDRITKRVNDMIQYRRPYEIAMKRSALEVEGISRTNPEDSRDETFVAPLAFMYVEQKTAEETSIAQGYEFVPVDYDTDAWKVDLLNDAKKHMESKTKFKETFIEWHRHKNMYGVGILRTGYRRITGIEHVPVNDDMGDITEWEECEVEKYNDLFFDLISPFDFAIDPSARSLDVAEDCVCWKTMNYNAFFQQYGNNKMYKDCDKVKPGIIRRFDDETRGELDMIVGGDQVLVLEYFNNITDEWVTYANEAEIRLSFLPDKHKELPFAAIHNHENYILEMSQSGSIFVSPIDKRDTSGASYRTTPQSTFWTKGDPEKIRDLTVLRTDFARAAARNAKLNGECIIATAPGKKFDPRRNWRSGDQAIGMMGQFQVAQMNNSPMGNFQFMFDMLDSLMTQTLGVDPRIMGDTKVKTAEEVATQREQGAKRLMMGIRKNQAGGITRLGNLCKHNIAQYYPIPFLQRLSGTEEDMTIFDEIEEDPRTGKPLYGKKYRRISSGKEFIEKKDGRKKNQYSLRATIGKERGKKSFSAKHITVCDCEVRTLGALEAGEVKVVQRQQYIRALELVGQLMNYVQTGLIKQEDLPNVKVLSQKIMETFGIDSKDALNSGTEDTRSTEEKTMEKYLKDQPSFGGAPIPQVEDAVPY